MGGTKTIGVLVGGVSAERELSVRAGEAVARALHEAGGRARRIFVDRDLDLALRQSGTDVAFVALRGFRPGNGCVQGLLDLMAIPYTGSGVLASALSANRAKTKEILRLHNLPTAPAIMIRADADGDAVESHRSFGFPVLVRPVAAPSLVGCAVVHDEVALETAIESALRVDSQVLVERFVEGRAVCVAVLDGVALGALDVAASGAEGPALPPRVSAAGYRSILRLATAAYEALGCEGAACVDMILSERQNEVILGVDTHPLLTPTSPLARIAQCAGLGFAALVQEILAGARVSGPSHKHNRRTLQIGFSGPERRAGAAGAH